MPIKKDECPECSTHTITINPSNTKVIAEFKAEYLANGKRRNVEQIVNKIIGEWAINRIHKNI